MYFYPSFNFKYRNWPLKLYEVQTGQLIMMCMFSRQTRVPDFVTKVWWNKYYEKQHNSASNQLLNIIRRHKISFVILHIWKEFENEHLEGNIMYILWTKTKIAKAKMINASIFLTKRLQIIHRTIYCLAYFGLSRQIHITELKLPFEKISLSNTEILDCSPNRFKQHFVS